MAKILHLISQLEQGGAQRNLSNLISRSTRHEVEIASLIASPRDRLFPFFQKSPVPIHYLSYSTDFYHPQILSALRKLLKEQRYDLVQCWLFESIIQGTIACKKQRVPCIASPRSMLSFLKSNHKLWERILVRKSLHAADLVLFPSYSSCMEYVDAGFVEPRRTRVSLSGVDCSHFKPEGEGDAVVAVGRLAAEKSFDVLQRVISQLRSFRPDLRAIVAGAGDRSFPDLETAGSVQDIRQVYRQAALYISTSPSEGLSVALLESQAMGIPAVVRNISSNMEVIEHGINGFLAKSVTEFVNYTREILQDHSLRKMMGNKAREFALERFSLDKQVVEVESVQDELL